MALAFENPAAFNGRLTAKPSGKFWIPMPMARLRALSKVAEADLGNKIKLYQSKNLQFSCPMN